MNYCFKCNNECNYKYCIKCFLKIKTKFKNVVINLNKINNNVFRQSILLNYYNIIK